LTAREDGSVAGEAGTADEPPVAAWSLRPGHEQSALNGASNRTAGLDVVRRAVPVHQVTREENGVAARCAGGRGSYKPKRGVTYGRCARPTESGYGSRCQRVLVPLVVIAALAPPEKPPDGVTVCVTAVKRDSPRGARYCHCTHDLLGIPFLFRDPVELIVTHRCR